MINLKSNRGMTLIEVLAVLILTVMIFSLATPILLSGLNRYSDIQKEITLRDEADLIMSKFFLEIYVLKESEIKKFTSSDGTGSSNYFIEYEKKTINPSTNTSEIKTYKLGFQDGALYFQDKPFSFSSPHIRLTTESKIEKIGDNNYRITLGLINAKKNKVTTFINEVHSINDKGEGN